MILLLWTILGVVSVPTGYQSCVSGITTENGYTREHLLEEASQSLSDQFDPRLGTEVLVSRLLVCAMEQSKALEAEKVRLISTRSTIDEVGGIESDVVSRYELSTREILNLFSAVTLNNSFSISGLADLKRRVYELRFHGVEIPRAEEFIDLKVDASLTCDTSGSGMGKHFGAFLVENPLIRVERSGDAPIDGELYRTLAAVYLKSLDDNLNPSNYLIISVPLFGRLRPAQTLVYLSFSGDLVVTRFYSDAQFSSEEPTPEILPSGRQILILSLVALRSEIPEILELFEGSLNRRLRVNDENARFHLPKRGQSENF